MKISTFFGAKRAAAPAAALIDIRLTALDVEEVADEVRAPVGVVDAESGNHGPDDDEGVEHYIDEATPKYSSEFTIKLPKTSDSITSTEE